jgi:hypothetical protein
MCNVDLTVHVESEQRNYKMDVCLNRIPVAHDIKIMMRADYANLMAVPGKL